MAIAEPPTYGDLVRAGRHKEAVDQALAAVVTAAGGDLSLRQEIGSLRLVLERVLVVDLVDGDVYVAAETVANLVEAITQAVRTQRLLSGGASDDLASAVDMILADLGLGE